MGDLAVIDVVLVDIAEAEGDLIGVILAVAQGGDLRLHVGLGVFQPGVLAHLHIGMGVVDAAVDDGHHDPLAGAAAVLRLPQLHGGGHFLGGGHPGLVGGDLTDGYHAVQGSHLLHLGPGHVHGKGADQIAGLVDNGAAGNAPDLTDDALLGAQGPGLGGLHGGGVGHGAGLLHGGGHVLGQVHEREPGSVPQLVDEVAVTFDTVFREADVAAHGGEGRQGEAQGVGAVFFDHHQRVDDVAGRRA